jgi:hypothetical protein
MVRTQRRAATRIQYLLATVATLFLTNQLAFACSCAPPIGETEEERIENALLQADTVVVAMVISNEQSLAPEDPSGRYRVEHAVFVVTEVFKGPHRVGDTIHVRSEVGPGICGRSVRNDPPWLEEFDERSIESTPVFSGEWIIYADGKEPYELSMCSRSFPMNLRGQQDAEYIRSIVRKGTADGINRQGVQEGNTVE